MKEKVKKANNMMKKSKKIEKKNNNNCSNIKGVKRDRKVTIKRNSYSTLKMFRFEGKII